MSMRVSYTSGLSLKLVEVYGAAVYIELHGGRPKTLVYNLYKAGTCEKQNQCFSVVAKDPRKHGERAGERVT